MATTMLADEPGGNNSSEDSLPRAIAAVPQLAVDEDMHLDVDDAEEEFEQNFERPFRNATRTLYNVSRGDSSTM